MRIKERPLDQRTDGRQDEAPALARKTSSSGSRGGFRDARCRAIVPKRQKRCPNGCHNVKDVHPALSKRFVHLPAAISGEDHEANGEFAVRNWRRKRTAVLGPIGPLTMADLPSSATTYWVSRRKAEVLAAIDGGLLDAEDACTQYRLSQEELESWRTAVDRAGVPGLRLTKLQGSRRAARQ